MNVKKNCPSVNIVDKCFKKHFLFYKIISIYLKLLMTLHTFFFNRSKEYFYEVFGMDRSEETLFERIGV